MKHYLNFTLIFMCTYFTDVNLAYSGQWGVGVGIRDVSSEYSNVESDLQLLPFPIYQGERLTIGIEGVSYLLLDSEPLQINLEAQSRFDGFDPDESDELKDMNERKPGIDLGFSVTKGGDWGEMKALFLGDVTSRSQGYEFVLAYQYISQVNNWVIAPETGVKFNSRRLVDYYYGVNADETTEERTEYKGEAETDIYVGLNCVYGVSNTSQVLLGVELTYLGDSKRDSPIVDRDYKAEFAIAYIYSFK